MVMGWVGGLVGWWVGGLVGWWVVGGGPEDVLYIFMFLELVYQCDALPDVFRWLQFF